MAIQRYKTKVNNILYSEPLNCYPAENQAAKIFVKWLREHPEYSIDDVNMRIVYYEREEDYYGNGGGIDKCIRIYQTIEETEEEYDARIGKEETESLGKFKNNLTPLIKSLIQDFNIYPNLESDEITAHVNNIEDAIIKIVKEKIHEQIK